MDWALWATVAAVMAWAHVPLIMVTLRLRWYRVQVIDDPGSVAPAEEDRASQALQGEIRDLGFTPLGTLIETCWFLSRRNWFWRSLEGIRVFASEDRKTFFMVHRLLAGEPPRFSALTLFTGGGSLRTSCPGAGIAREVDPRYRRIELQQVGPAQLLDSHAASVAEFCQTSGLTPQSAKMADLAEEDRTYTLLYLSRQSVMPEWIDTLWSYVAPLFASDRFHGGNTGRGVALTLLAGAVINQGRQWWFFRFVRPRRVIASHSPRPPAV